MFSKLIIIAAPPPGTTDKKIYPQSMVKVSKWVKFGSCQDVAETEVTSGLKRKLEESEHMTQIEKIRHHLLLLRVTLFKRGKLSASRGVLAIAAIVYYIFFNGEVFVYSRKQSLGLIKGFSVSVRQMTIKIIILLAVISHTRYAVVFSCVYRICLILNCTTTHRKMTFKSGTDILNFESFTVSGRGTLFDRGARTIFRIPRLSLWCGPYWRKYIF